MDFKNLLPATNRDELRQWLSENHNKEDECWVVVKRGRPVDNGTFGTLTQLKKQCVLVGSTVPQRKWIMA